MGENVRPSAVYVSYNREKEYGNNTLIHLQDKLKNIPFKVDQYEVEDGDDFLDFIHEIGAADYIVVILSDVYFKSFYCMYELTKIIQHGEDIQSRVFVIRENGYELNNENNKKHIRDYWQRLYAVGDAERPEELSKYGTPEQIKEIHETLESIFEQFSTWQSKTPRQLIESRYIALLSWLDDSDHELDVEEREFVESSKFLQEIRLKIQSITSNPLIKHTLKETLDCTKAHDSMILEKLCTGDTANLIKTLDGPLKNTVINLKSHQAYVSEIREAIRELASLLIYFLVNKDWVEQVRKNKITVLEIPAKSELTGSAASAMVFQTFQRYHAEPTNSEVESYGKVKVPTKQLSWSNKNSKIVKGLITHIYNHVFPKSPYKALDEHNKLGEIDDGEIEAFNEQLLQTKAHFFLILPDDESYSYLDEPQLLHELKRKLPAVIIIKLASATKSELVIEKDERLRMAYQRFLVNL